jgi:hypothetical protein
MKNLSESILSNTSDKVVDAKKTAEELRIVDHVYSVLPTISKLYTSLGGRVDIDLDFWGTKVLPGDLAIVSYDLYGETDYSIGIVVSHLMSDNTYRVALTKAFGNGNEDDPYDKCTTVNVHSGELIVLAHEKNVKPMLNLLTKLL